MTSALALYLACFVFASSVTLGALTLSMIGRLTRPEWYDALRGPTERLASGVVLLGISADGVDICGKLAFDRVEDAEIEDVAQQLERTGNDRDDAHR